MTQHFIVEETSFDGKTWIERQRAPWSSSTFDYLLIFHSRAQNRQFLGENARYVRACIKEVEVSDPTPPEPKTEFVGYFREVNGKLEFISSEGLPIGRKVRVIVEDEG